MYICMYVSFCMYVDSILGIPMYVNLRDSGTRNVNLKHVQKRLRTHDNKFRETILNDFILVDNNQLVILFNKLLFITETNGLYKLRQAQIFIYFLNGRRVVYFF